MDRLSTMYKQEYLSRMQTECRRILEEVADAVNDAPTGNVISGCEMEVRDLVTGNNAGPANIPNAKDEGARILNESEFMIFIDTGALPDGKMVV